MEEHNGILNYKRNGKKVEYFKEKSVTTLFSEAYRRCSVEGKCVADTR